MSCNPVISVFCHHRTIRVVWVSAQSLLGGLSIGVSDRDANSLEARLGGLHCGPERNSTHRDRT